MLTRNHFLRNKSLPQVTFRRSPEPNNSDFESFHSQNIHLAHSRLEADKSNFFSQGQNQKKQTLTSLLVGALPNYDSVKVNKGSIRLGDVSGNVFSTRQPNQISARQKSEKKIVRAREKAREATFHQWEKISELKETLSIYQADEGTATFPNRKHIQKILECLESLNSEDNELGGLMTLVIKVLKTTTYIDWHFSEFILQKLENNIETKELLKVLQNSFHEKIPYYTLARVLFEELIKKQVKIQDKENQHEKDIKNFKTIIQRKEKEIQQVHEKYKQTILVEDYNKAIKERDNRETLCQELGVQISGLKENIKGFEGTIVDLKKERDNYIEEIKFLANKVTECLEEHENTKQKLTHQISLNFDECERIKKYKKLIDTTIIKIADFKQQIANLKHCNNELFLQNKRLNVRAAAGFINLTPRPDYSKAFGEISFDKKSTIQIFEELLLERAEQGSEKNRNRKSPKKSKEIVEIKKSDQQEGIPNETKSALKQLVIFRRSRSLSAKPRQSLNDSFKNLPLKFSKENLDILRASKTIGDSSFLPRKNDSTGSLNQSLCSDIYEDNLNLANKMLDKLVAAKKGL